VISGIETFVLAALMVVIVLIGMSRFTSASGMVAPAAAGSVVGTAVMLVACPVLGFLSGVLMAVAYNLAGMVTGGLEVEAAG
jgi:hypothetical protein